MNADSHTVESFVAKRDAALRSLDMDYGRAMMPGAKDEVVLIAMHKARYEATNIEDEYRYQSRLWLEERGYKRIHGMAFPKDRLELPK